MTEDEKQIEKAKEDVAEKGADSQTEKDRVDESVGEQEKRSGNENSQNAKDRVDESEATKKADEERAEEKREEKGDELSEKILSAVNSAVEKAVGAAVEKAVSRAFENMQDRQATKASPEEEKGLKQIENIYN